MKQYALNCIGTSPEDTRDYAAPYVPAWGKQSIDFMPWCRIIENQGSTSSCVAQGIEGLIQVPINILRGIDYMEGIKMVDLDAFNFYDDLCKTYYEGNTKRGSYPRDGMKHLHQRGILELSPHGGRIHQIESYWRCNTLAEAVNSILTSGPLTAALKIYKSFMDSRGKIPMPAPHDPHMGYHQVTLVSRINSGDLKGWRLRNSWGNEWGNCGYAFISDEVLMALEPEIWGCSYKASFEEKIELCERMTQL